MLSIDDQKKLLKLLKFSDEQIAEYTGDEVKPLELTEGLRVYTPEEYTTLEANLRDKGKSTHINAGMEIAIKKLKEQIGLEYEGKDPETFIEKAKEKFLAEAKLPADKAREQWEAEKRQLQQRIEEEQRKYQEAEGKYKAIQLDSDYLSAFPDNRSKSLPDSDRLLLLKSKLQRHEEDGKEYYTYNGKRIQDDKANDLSLKDAIAHVFTNEKWIGDSGAPEGSGLGDGHSKGGGSYYFKTTKEMRAAAAAQDIKLNTPEFETFRKAAMAANPNIQVVSD